MSWRPNDGRWNACSGRELGDFVRALHEEHGVIFHLEETVTAIDGKNVRLKERRDARGRSRRRRHRRAAAPRARREGRPHDRPRRGRQRIPGDQRAGHLRRRRHRALARSAQWANRSASSTGWSPSARARPPRATCSGGANVSTPCRSSGASITTSRSTTSAMPRSGTTLEIEGDIKARDCVVRYRRDGKLLAVASIYRDVDSLKEEWAMERRVA